MIYGFVKEQHLDICGKVVANSIDYTTAHFAFFSPEWKEIAKYVQFQQGETKYFYKLYNDEISANRHLNLSAGEWVISLCGIVYENGKLAKKITTNSCKFIVEEAGDVEMKMLPIVGIGQVDYMEI